MCILPAACITLSNNYLKNWFNCSPSWQIHVNFKMGSCLQSIFIYADLPSLAHSVKFSFEKGGILESTIRTIDQITYNSLIIRGEF